MQTSTIPIDSIHLDPANVRKHDDRNLSAIKASLARFGQQKPIVVDANGIVRAGNGTLTAARALGWSTIEIVRSELKGSDATAFAIADNKTSDLSEFDDQPLAETLEALRNEDPELLDASGFESEELDALLEGLADDLLPDQPEDPVLVVGSDELLRKWGVEAGQVWEIPSLRSPGRSHRLLCGDSTVERDVTKLLDGIRPSMTFADPPYGYSYRSNQRTKSAKFDVLENDDRILDGFLDSVEQHTDGWVLVCTSWKVLREWLDATDRLGDLQNLIVWDKGGGGMGDLVHSLSTDYELILAYNRGAKISGKRIGSVWDIPKDAASTYVHATQKPVELGLQAFEAFASDNCYVYDPFVGSGMTMLAAEQSGRICRGIELDPANCAITLERLSSLGLTPSLQAG